MSDLQKRLISPGNAVEALFSILVTAEDSSDRPGAEASSDGARQVHAAR